MNILKMSKPVYRTRQENAVVERKITKWLIQFPFKTKDANVLKAGKLPKWLLQQASNFFFLPTFQMVTWHIRQKNKEKEDKLNRSGKYSAIW